MKLSPGGTATAFQPLRKKSRSGSYVAGAGGFIESANDGSHNTNASGSNSSLKSGGGGSKGNSPPTTTYSKHSSFNSQRSGGIRMSDPPAKYNADDPGFTLSPDTIDAATLNFDPQFTRLAVETDDGTGNFPGSMNSQHSSMDDGDMFAGFTFDEMMTR